MTAMRRKMKKLPAVMTEKQFADWFRSWYISYKKYMSRVQKENIIKLFNKELERCIS